jgi:hypothetical protein
LWDLGVFGFWNHGFWQNNINKKLCCY